ncbi:hypothetical protein [Cognatishimia sp. F0-27]|uniref:hypothetical protein n=1 Tax=Cognatishimia sp. F0-27 TaxID=2816855 RepID=UPI001D0C47D6|nr:hypothetical protein [Cognatishimia sp. F0-27]MCC1495043.1 hypothetical protein [Cognatishimia sp. F0-27]
MKGVNLLLKWYHRPYPLGVRIHNKKHDNGGQFVGRYEDFWALVVADVDAPPVFEKGKAVIDYVALLVSLRVARNGHLGAFARLDTGRISVVSEGFAIPIRVTTATISEHVFGLGKVAQQSPCADVIAALASRQTHPHRPANRIRDGIKL